MLSPITVQTLASHLLLSLPCPVSGCLGWKQVADDMAVLSSCSPVPLLDLRPSSIREGWGLEECEGRQAKGSVPPSILLCALELDPWDQTNRLPWPRPPVGFGQWEALARDGGSRRVRSRCLFPCSFPAGCIPGRRSRLLSVVYYPLWVLVTTSSLLPLKPQARNCQDLDRCR